jgi:CRP-like cAMP-binding protein
MSTRDLLKHVPLFAALSGVELDQISAIAVEKKGSPYELIVSQNTMGDDMYIIAQGAVEVFIDGLADERVLVVLGKGQVVGEMALIDYGFRSASVRATKDGCRYSVIHRDDFNALCEENNRIGYIVMKNLAIDLAFKLRHRNLTEM